MTTTDDTLDDAILGVLIGTAIVTGAAIAAYLWHQAPFGLCRLLEAACRPTPRREW